MIPELKKTLEGVEAGKPDSYNGQLKSILSNANIFGIDLYEAESESASRKCLRKSWQARVLCGLPWKNIWLNRKRVRIWNGT